jgi:hypothetical protein
MQGGEFLQCIDDQLPDSGKDNHGQNQSLKLDEIIVLKFSKNDKMDVKEV